MAGERSSPNLKSRADIVGQLRDIGVEPGDVLLVHTSFRAVRPIDDGPTGLIDALIEVIGPQGTLVMPSWPGREDEPFDPSSTPADDDLGIVAQTFWRVPGVQRSDQFFAFAAYGPEAPHILQDPLPLPPHRPESPVGRVHELDGKVLLLGVHHDANTTIHLAEVIANVPYRIEHQYTIVQDGQPVSITYGENDCCCERFRLVDGWLLSRGLLSTGYVGNAWSRLMRSRDVIDITIAQLARDPLLFLHEAGAGCSECDEARRSIAG